MTLSREIFAISNRGYTPGFLVGNPEAKGIYHEKNVELKEEDFIGIVRGYDETTKLATLEVKNRFDLGDMIRIISPNGSFEFELTSIIGPDGLPREAAHGGSFDVQIAVPENPGDYAIVRKPLLHPESK